MYLEFEGDDGATTTTDSATGGNAPHSVTLSSAELDDSVSPPFGTTALYCNGTGGCAYMSYDSDFSLGTGDFTVESYVRLVSGPTSPYLFGDFRNDYGWALQYRVNDELFYFWRDFNNVTSLDCTLSYNTWTHIAVVRDGNTMRLYKNGVQQDTGVVTGFNYNTDEPLYIGKDDDQPNTIWYWKGHIKGARIYKGWCRYPDGTSFTSIDQYVVSSSSSSGSCSSSSCSSSSSESISSSSCSCSSSSSCSSSCSNSSSSSDGGQVDDDTILLLHFDGADEATSTTDSALGGNAPHTPITFSGNTELSTDQKKYGSAALYIHGGSSSDEIYLPSDSDWDFGADGKSNFTIECWFRRTDASSWMTICSQYDGSSGSICLMLRYRSSDNHIRAFLKSTAGGSTIGDVDGGSIAVDTWYHVAYCRQGSTFRLYIDGTQVDTATSSFRKLDANYPLYIGGRYQGDVGIESWRGYIDEFRISKVCRYPDGTGFTPSGPFSQYTGSSSSSSLSSSSYSCSSSCSSSSESFSCSSSSCSSSSSSSSSSEAAEFVTTWLTTEEDETITLPLRSGSMYNMVVDWGDGSEPDTIVSWHQAEKTHTFSTPGTQTITITGTCEAWHFNNTGDCAKFRTVETWADLGFTSIGLQNAFYGCSNATSFGDAIPAIDAITDLYSAWRNCSSCTSFPDISALTNVTVMSYTWRNCTSATSFPSISALTSLTTILGAWYECSGCTTVPVLMSSSSALDNVSYAFDEIGSGMGGTVVELWDSENFPNITLYTNTFDEATGLTNYGDIPAGWK